MVEYPYTILKDFHFHSYCLNDVSFAYEMTYDQNYYPSFKK